MPRGVRSQLMWLVQSSLVLVSMQCAEEHAEECGGPPLVAGLAPSLVLPTNLAVLRLRSLLATWAAISA